MIASSVALEPRSQVDFQLPSQEEPRLYEAGYH